MVLVWKNVNFEKSNKKQITTTFIEVPNCYLLRKIIIADGDLLSRWEASRKKL